MLDAKVNGVHSPQSLAEQRKAVLIVLDSNPSSPETPYLLAVCLRDRHSRRELTAQWRRWWVGGKTGLPNALRSHTSTGAAGGLRNLSASGLRAGSQRLELFAYGSALVV